MDILQFINAFLPARGFGGTVTTVHEVAKRLAKRGHHITIATTDMVSSSSRKPNLKRSEWIDGILVKRFPVRFRFHQYYFTPKMLRELRGEKSTIVHGNGARNFQSDLGSLYAHYTDTPFILSGYGSLLYYGIGDTLSKALYDGLTLKLLIKKANLFIGVSRIECKAAVSYGIAQEKIRLIQSGTDLTEFSNSCPEELIEKYDLKRFNSDNIILFVGRITPIKGLDFLFESLSKLLQDQRFKNVLFLIIGEDQQYWEYLQSIKPYNEIKSHLVWISNPSRQDIINAYSLADILVLPSLFEHSPIVIHEAGACKLPVIATKVGGIPDIIANGKNGLLVEYGDITQLVSQIKLLLTNKEIKKRMGQALYEQTKKKYSWDIVAQNHETLYKSLIL